MAAKRALEMHRGFALNIQLIIDQLMHVLRTRERIPERSSWNNSRDHTGQMQPKWKNLVLHRTTEYSERYCFSNGAKLTID